MTNPRRRIVRQMARSVYEYRDGDGPALSALRDYGAYYRDRKTDAFFPTPRGIDLYREAGTRAKMRAFNRARGVA